MFTVDTKIANENNHIAKLKPPSAKLKCKLDGAEGRRTEPSPFYYGASSCVNFRTSNFRAEAEPRRNVLIFWAISA